MTTLELNGTNVSGVHMPVIGLGTWPMTGQQCVNAVSRAVRSGYRHLDTAQNYGNEEAVGAGVRLSGTDRESVFITSKLNAEHHGDVTRVRAGVEERLNALGVGYLDLILIHWPNPEQGRWPQTAEALADLMSSGLFRAWGVSNFKASHIEELTRAGLRAPINQIQVDPLAQAKNNRWANDAAGTLTCAYSPVGRNLELTAHPALTTVAARLGRTEHQVVLRWHIQQGRVAIPKSADPERQKQNLDILDFELTEDDMAGIEALDTGRGPFLDADKFGH